MTEFQQDDQPQATPGTEGAIAPSPAQPERIGVGALLGRLSADEAAA
jgi:hypothetical protein